MMMCRRRERAGPPHSWGTCSSSSTDVVRMMMILVRVPSIINLGRRCLDLTLLVINENVSSFTWDGSQERVCIFLQKHNDIYIQVGNYEM
jgi:hypothetical protein